MIIRSMSQTIDDFQNFFKPDKGTEPFDPRISLENALGLLRKVLRKENIRLAVSTEDAITLHGIPNELTQVLVNLIQNAKDALSSGGRDDPFIAIRLIQKDAHAIISVEDNAGGVPPEASEAIFEPYFTTKHASKGTGLGLFMSKLIIEKSFNGTLTFHNTNRGACFAVTIPISEEP